MWLLCCWDDMLIDFLVGCSLNMGSKINDKAIEIYQKNQSKLKCMLRWTLHGSRIDFGGFWEQVGR